MSDIVYFVKEAPLNEELVYSLRSVEANFPHGKVWIYGGLPKNIKPDEYVYQHQVGMKWERVRNMVFQACLNNAITEDFWIFNDDFFVMKPVENPQNYYDRTLEKRADEIEERNGRSIYTMRLRSLANLLKSEGFETKNYAVHLPMLINRKKMLEVLDKYPRQAMFRALYGNFWNIGGTEHGDVKIKGDAPLDCMNPDFLSSSDLTWIRPVGAYVRKQFTEPSRFESLD